jgi:heme-binding protein
MRRTVRSAAVALVVITTAIQFVRPARTNPLVDPSHALAELQPVPAHVTAVLDRACRDCHSNNTRWPWYSQVAPVSWWVIDHVNHGRSHFNYSDWARYPAADRARLLKNSCDLVREDSMPLPSYRWMHRRARLSKADVQAICELAE